MKKTVTGLAPLYPILYCLLQLSRIHAQNFEVTHLLEATKKGDLDTIKEHVDLLPAVEQKYGCTLLHEAVFFDHMSIITFLAEHDTEALNKKTTAKDGGYSPIYYAISEGHYEAVVFLCRAGADLTIHCGKFGLTPLHVAVESGRLDILTFLVTQYNADVNILSTTGETPLYIACQNNLPTVVKFLIDHHADVNKTESDWTPFHIAIQNDHKDVIKFLMASKDLDVNRASKHETTPLYIAAHCGKIKLVEKLLALGAAVKKPRIEGLTPLHVAAGNGHVAIVRLLLSYGADPTAQDQQQRTPSYYVTCDNPENTEQKEIAELLAAAENRFSRRKRSHALQQKKQSKARKRQKKVAETEVSAQDQPGSPVHTHLRAQRQSSHHEDIVVPHLEPQSSSRESLETQLLGPQPSPTDIQQQEQTVLQQQLESLLGALTQQAGNVDHTSTLPFLAQIMATAAKQTPNPVPHAPPAEVDTECFLTIP